MSNFSFIKLGLAGPIQRALKARNYMAPTPIQERVIPQVLRGRDILGIAQTGTGKTAAFALPIIHQVSQKYVKQDGEERRSLPQALILAPTRELAIQINEEFKAFCKYLPLRPIVIFGGVSQKSQVRSIARGVDIITSTPGRLIDLMGQKRLKLDAIKCCVLDEADRMLDMGFVLDVRKIIAALPKNCQSLMFSATMPSEIAHLSSEILSRPTHIEVATQSTPIKAIEQIVYYLDGGSKLHLLTKILENTDLSRVIVFCRTKDRANRICEKLVKLGIAGEAIHGNKSQNARQSALLGFRNGAVKVLVATDIASRGIDVAGVSHVINYDIPSEPEVYIHRIGRTARAGASGIAISFCDTTERKYLRNIEKMLGTTLCSTGNGPEVKSQRKPKLKKIKKPLRPE